MPFSERGIPILTLDEKLEALEYCMLRGSDEDSLGHLFDLINHVAPGYRFKTDLCDFPSLHSLMEHYGANPTPILPPKERP